MNRFWLHYPQSPKIGYYRDPKTDKELDVVVTFPRNRIVFEVKYRENPRISEKEAIVEWANEASTASSIIITKSSEDYGLTAHQTETPIMKIPAFAFLYLLGHAEYMGYQS